MDVWAGMTAMRAAALYIGLLIVLMMALKIHVGRQRAKYKVPSGDVSNVEFSRHARVQLNAVEDVPVLMAGLLALAALDLPAWYIHMSGATLLVSRIAHAVGLSRPNGQSLFRLIGTIGTLLVYLAIAGALVTHALAQAPG